MTRWARCSSVPKIAAAALAFFGLAPMRPALAGDRAQTCPVNSISVEPGSSIQSMVDRAGDGAVFCLKAGIHRAQAIRPRAGQHFHGEGGTVLNGSLLLDNFTREGRYWVANSRLQRVAKHGECLPRAPGCNEPYGLFIDDRPLTRTLSKAALATNEFYVDQAGGRVFIADDPASRRVEVTVAAFAFESNAPDVLIANLTVEKYGSPAQRGAIHAREGVRWTMKDCVVKLNSGAGISVGTGSRVFGCDVHHNGQIGIEGHGEDIVIDGNRIWANNIYGFDPEWEAGGVKIAISNGVTFRGNRVTDNDGAGLWCDIECRDVVFEDNFVENNQHVGIFHEISFKAVIRRNVVRHNGRGRTWYWHADILIAASQDVEVVDNTVTVEPGGCGIMLIDQGRRGDNGTLYKTRNNFIHGNEMTFEDAPCAGGVSDVKPGEENYSIITGGNNRFDANTYRVRTAAGRARFVWGHELADWDGFRRKGLERTGRLVPAEASEGVREKSDLEPVPSTR